jgi:hypothetical protein
MKRLEIDYRPKNIEFEVANNTLPDNLGDYASEKEVYDFIHKNLIGINQQVTVFRYMDNFEKNEIRKEYQDLLEAKLPLLEKELQVAASNLVSAKRAFNKATEYVSATTNEAIALAIEVKRGTKEITLDDPFTWRIPFKGKFYFYTFINNQLKLAKVSEIMADEKNELFNATELNEQFFEANFLKENE